jgi:hypothetical protein
MRSRRCAQDTVFAGHDQANDRGQLVPRPFEDGLQALRDSRTKRRVIGPFDGTHAIRR